MIEAIPDRVSNAGPVALEIDYSDRVEDALLRASDAVASLSMVDFRERPELWMDRVEELLSAAQDMKYYTAAEGVARVRQTLQGVA